MPSRPPSFSGPRLAASACPRCGSSEIRRLSLIHAAGLPPDTDRKPHHEALLAKHAAPPTRKPGVAWAVAALVFVSTAIVAWERSTVLTTAALLCVAVGIGFAARAMTYNTMVYPRLYEQWERSSICNRCGSVFAD